MKILILLSFLFTGQRMPPGQTNDMLQKCIVTSLSYKTIAYKSSGKDSKISVHQIEFDGSTVSYPIFKKTGNKTERFTVRMLISGIAKISMPKNKEGYYVLLFTTKRKSIIKEYANGSIIHEKWEVIPLTEPNVKALACFQKLHQAYIRGK